MSASSQTTETLTDDQRHGTVDPRLAKIKIFGDSANAFGVGVKFEHLRGTVHLVRVEAINDEFIYVRTNPDGRLSWGAIETFGYSEQHATDGLVRLLTDPQVSVIRTTARPPLLWKVFHKLRVDSVAPLQAEVFGEAKS